MSRRRDHLLGQLTGLGIVHPESHDLPALIDWALPLLPGLTEEGIAVTFGLLAERAWHTDGASLEALLPRLEACDAIHRDRLGVPSRELWRHLAKNLDHVTLWRTLAGLALREDRSGRSAGEYALKALRRGAREPAMVRAAVMGHLQHGRLTEAAALLQRHPGCPDHDALLHLASQDTPLPVPLCGCATHPDRSDQPPPSDWLKVFFQEGDSLYDAETALCLSCHTVWCEAEDYMNSTPTWSRRALSVFLRPEAWSIGLAVSPAEAMVTERDQLIRLIRAQREPAASYGMV